MTEPRRFSAAQRQALYLHADGRCENCHAELEDGWHADHIVPWSMGGATDVTNGQALCPDCNLRKGTNVNNPYAWQDECVDQMIKTRSTVSEFLAAVTPAGGKTRMSLKYAAAGLADRTYSKIVVVVPSVNLQMQWRDTAATFGIHFKTRELGGNLRDFHGVVVTYQGLGSLVTSLELMCARARVLVIFDEAHHMGDAPYGAEERPWATHAKQAFGRAERKVLLTGTPWRSDGGAIPFCRYDDEGQLVCDYRLSYGRALRLGLVRPAVFELLQGSGEWLFGEDKYDGATDNDNMTEQETRHLLRTLYKPDHPFMERMLVHATRRLDDLRTKRMPNAALLVIADDQKHAKAYSKRLRSMLGDDQVVCVTSDVEDAHQQIKAFGSSGKRCIVAVRMVSEGVDIPRIAVEAYASATLTELFFQQAVGRATRKTEHNVKATVFMANVSPLRDYARKMEEDYQVVLAEIEAAERDRKQRDLSDPEARRFLPLTSDGGEVDKVIAGTKVYDGRMMAHVDALAKAHQIDADPVSIVAMFDELQSGAVTIDTAPTFTPIVTQEEKMLALRKDLDELVKQLSWRIVQPMVDRGQDAKKLMGPTIKTINRELVDHFEKRRDDLTIDELELAIRYVSRQLA